jgi:hypothetical protein
MEDTHRRALARRKTEPCGSFDCSPKNSFGDDFGVTGACGWLGHPCFHVAELRFVGVVLGPLKVLGDEVGFEMARLHQLDANIVRH